MTSDKTQANEYSRHWFEFFHADIDEARIFRETDFIYRFAPQPEFQKILDVCCGMGRHARALSERGYSVTGIDRDPDVIATARELDGGPNYIVIEIRDYQPTPREFDAAVVMGQSFGHFDEAGNLDVLRRVATGIRKRGRIILDLWSPEFFKAHQGDRDLETPRGVVHENKRVENDRLFVHLKYPDATEEKFEWQLFSSDQMEAFAKSVGLRLLSASSGFDTSKPPSPADPRIQFILER